MSYREAQLDREHHGHSRNQVIKAWTPWLLMTVILAIWGIPWVKNHVLNWPGNTRIEHCRSDNICSALQRVSAAPRIRTFGPLVNEVAQVGGSAPGSKSTADSTTGRPSARHGRSDGRGSWVAYWHRRAPRGRPPSLSRLSRHSRHPHRRAAPRRTRPHAEWRHSAFHQTSDRRSGHRAHEQGGSRRF